jgi:hypothetical protein
MKFKYLFPKQTKITQFKLIFSIFLLVALTCGVSLYELVSTINSPRSLTPLKNDRVLVVSSSSPSLSVYVKKTIALLRSLNYSYDVVDLYKEQITLDMLIDLKTDNVRYASLIFVAELVQWCLSNNEISIINEVTRTYGIGQLWLFVWHDLVLENFGLKTINSEPVNCSLIRINGTNSGIDGTWNLSIPVRNIALESNFPFMRKVYSTALITENETVPVVCFRRLGDGNIVLLNYELSHVEESSLLWNLFHFSFELSLRGVIN